MYTSYWGFNEKPFENAPDPKFMYYSNQHIEALSRLLYAVSERKSASILTGEYGSGKTVISRIVANRLIGQEGKYNVALIVNPAISAIEILREILYQLGGETDKDIQKIEVLRILNEKLYMNMNENRHAVVIIDEAQAINSPLVFEEIRLLLNFQTDNRFLLTLLLLGQPELKQKVASIPQLEQRFSVKYHLGNLSLEEVTNYIDHRCAIAGKKEKIFTGSAYNAIYEASGGIPRKINNICDISLMLGSSKKLNQIDADIIRAVAEDLKEYKETEIGLQDTEKYTEEQV
ncbi:MAG: AAA family ATPase [Candidatus Omnitrophota bacterium]